MKITQCYVAMLAMTAAILVSGCKKKPADDPMPVTNCEIKYQAYFGDVQSTTESATASYQNGQITSLNYASGKLNYEYLADVVNISGGGTTYYRIELADKLAKKIFDLSSEIEERMSYDGNRNLVKIESYYKNVLTDTKILAYANGNLYTLTQTFADSPNAKRVTTYSYSADIAGKVESENRHLLFELAQPYIPTFLLGTSSRNVLTRTSFTNTSGNFQSDTIKDYIYTKNSEGGTSKIVENSHTVTVSNGVQTQDERLKQTILISTTCSN